MSHGPVLVKLLLSCSRIAASANVQPLHAAMDPRFELSPHALEETQTRKPAARAAGMPPAPVPRRATAAAVGKSFTLTAPSPASYDQQETLRQIKYVWDRIVPQKGELSKPLTLHSSTFTLTLDPKRYPCTRPWMAAGSWWTAKTPSRPWSRR